MNRECHAWKVFQLLMALSYTEQDQGMSSSYSYCWDCYECGCEILSLLAIVCCKKNHHESSQSRMREWGLEVLLAESSSSLSSRPVVTCHFPVNAITIINRQESHHNWTIKKLYSSRSVPPTTVGWNCSSGITINYRVGYWRRITMRNGAQTHSP